MHIDLPWAGATSLIKLLKHCMWKVPATTSMTLVLFLLCGMSIAHAGRFDCSITSVSPVDPDVGDEVTFQGVAMGGGAPYNFTWEFGDGNTSVEMAVAEGGTSSVTNTYTAAGTYTVTMNVTGNVNHKKQSTCLIKGQLPTVTVKVGTGGINNPPHVTDPGAQTNDEGDTVSLQIAASDDPGDILTYSATGLPANLGINANTGLISGTVATGAAANSPYSVTVNVSDGANITSATFQWVVNDTTVPVDPFIVMVQHDLQFASQQLDATAQTITTTQYPSLTTSSGNWSTAGSSFWMSGFFPGSLWHMYEWSAADSWKEKAEMWLVDLEPQKYDTSSHDVGFKIFNSFGNGYRLTSYEPYRQVILTAALSLATRYNPTVGAIQSWNGPTSSDFRVIIDNMMNLELLFRASKNGGESTWYDMAVSHALKTRDHHVRADGSTYQIVNFDPVTGEVQGKDTWQGYDVESTWSRGQAWAVYGFTMAYRETGDSTFLDTARKTADYFIANLPADHVPYWDFELPKTRGEPRDSSAAAIAASGLLELSQLETDATRSQIYLDAARDIITSLSSPAYLAEGTGNDAILLHGTYSRYGEYDRGLIFGDYYFVEALLRYQSWYGQ